MNYHGLVLSTTFLRHENGSRYAFVSDETGFPLESIGRVRHGKLDAMRKGQAGWRVIGTWPVGKHPKTVWEDDGIFTV